MGFAEWVMANGWKLQLAGFYGTCLTMALMEALAPFSGGRAGRGRRWTVNFGLQVLAILLLSVVPLTSIGTSIWTGREGAGLLNWVLLPAPLVILVTATSRSLTAWIMHWSMHQVPFLWRVHRIHHLDSVLDVSTTVRFHPIEVLLNLLAIVALGVLLGLPTWALFLYEPLEAALRFFSHSNIRIPAWLDRVLRAVVATPSVHRFHHSALPSDYEHNFGAIFSFWDRLFGTYVSPEGRDLSRMPLGVRGPWKGKEQSLIWLIFGALVEGKNRRPAAVRSWVGWKARRTA